MPRNTISFNHISWDREAKAYECQCGYLQGETNGIKAQKHLHEYLEAEQWAKVLDNGGPKLNTMNTVWPISTPPKPGDINDTPYKKITGENLSKVFPNNPAVGQYNGLPVVYSNMIPRGSIYVISDPNRGKHLVVGNYQPVAVEDDDFDNAGRAYSDILLDEVGRHYEKPKKKWYFLWLK